MSDYSSTYTENTGDDIDTTDFSTEFAAIETAVATKYDSDDFLDEDDMASDDATKIASQQSIKAYVDAVPSQTRGTVATLSGGTTEDFTIPSGVKSIQVIVSGVSGSGVATIGVQLGDAGGIETTGYTCRATRTVGAAIASYTATTQIYIAGTAAAADTTSGILTLTNITGNVWIGSGTASSETAAAAHSTAGSKTLSAELTTVRLILTGAGTWDAGQVNVLYDI